MVEWDKSLGNHLSHLKTNLQKVQLNCVTLHDKLENGDTFREQQVSWLAGVLKSFVGEWKFMNLLPQNLSICEPYHNTLHPNWAASMSRGPQQTHRG